jgi:hypothetical protein
MQDPMDEWPPWADRSAPPQVGELGRLSAAPPWTHGAAGMEGISPRPSRPPCSKCHGEPRYPGQRWGPRCFARYHADRRAQRRHERAAHRGRDQATMSITRRPSNTLHPSLSSSRGWSWKFPNFAIARRPSASVCCPTGRICTSTYEFISRASPPAKVSPFIAIWCRRSWRGCSERCALGGTTCRGSMAKRLDWHVGRRASPGRKTSGNRRPTEDTHDVGADHG